MWVKGVERTVRAREEGILPGMVLEELRWKMGRCPQSWHVIFSLPCLLDLIHSLLVWRRGDAFRRREVVQSTAMAG